MSRFAPFTGIVFAILGLVSIFTSKTSPGPSASGARVIAFYTAHRSSQQTSDFLFAFAFVFFVFFVGPLYGFVRRTPGAQTLAAVGLGGAFLLALGIVLFAGVDFVLADVPGKLAPAAAQALNVLDNDLFLPLLVGAVVFGIAMGLAVVRSGRLPVWLGWVLLVLGIATGTPAFFVGLIGLLIWTVVVSVLLYRRSGQPGAFTAAAST